MRFNGVALFASALLVAACGGGESKPADTGAAAAPAVEPAPMVAPAAGTMAPITGTIHEVKMLLDDKGTYKFEPVSLTAAVGDGVKFVMVSGAPHNVAFDVATVPEELKAQLQANMPNSAGNYDSPMMMTANESWTVSLGALKAGKYGIICTPHLAMGMKMDLVIQ